MSSENAFRPILETFADTVRQKCSQVTTGEPEDQLRGPFEAFMSGVGKILSCEIVCVGETILPGRLGKPDYAVNANKLLTGYVELKAPGFGANPSLFKGHNRNQWKRFSSIPNLLYSDGNEWGLYRQGEQIGKLVRLSGDITDLGKKAIGSEDAHAIERLLQDFISWQPILPKDRKGHLDIKGFATMLAPLCKMLREDVVEALKDSSSPLVQLATDWRQLLFPDASDEQFADAYAQTVTFALLLARSEKADPLTLESAEKALSYEHGLLSRALKVLTDPAAQAEISASLNLVLRIIAEVSPTYLSGSGDPWLYFYEDFLAVYDPKLRKDAGAYYTPVEVVHAQVRLIDDLLVKRLGRQLGFADPSVLTLDPATGTGTYLLGIIEHALGRVEVEQGAGAVPGQATNLAQNLYGFEIMVGPYAVTELRVTRALRDHGATIPEDGTHIFLTDTLESPNSEPPHLPFFLKPIADQHSRALQVKSTVPVIVCLGNPPYDRHEAVDVEDESNLSRYGGWVRFGDPIGDTVKDVKGNVIKLKSAKARLERRQRISILKDFIDPAISARHGVRAKNLYNLYVYFWRWALWKVFEHEIAPGPGVVSYISASSYLDGDAFCGMREHMRRICDEIWIIDLGGEGRGTRKSENVFAIQTPVAIAVAIRSRKAKEDKPAKVHYVRIDGTRPEKLAILNAIDGFHNLKWQDCPEEWLAPFRPAGKGKYFDWPLLTDLMPWQHSGIQFKRTWPICPDPKTLENRWRALLTAKQQPKALKETRDRKVSSKCPPLFGGKQADTPLDQLPHDASTPPIERYAYRSFDRQWIFADSRLGDYLRPDLWRAHSQRQVYLTTAFTQAISDGPSVTVTANIPDLHHFSGRGAKDVVPLYRAAEASEANILPGLLELLNKIYKHEVTQEDFLAYLYGILAQPAFTRRYAKELETRELRIPITKDVALFKKISQIGAKLLWLHTYGERFIPNGKQRGQVPTGVAKCTKAVPGDPDGYPERFDYDETTQTLHVGAGKFSPVSIDVFEFEVSGLKVVQSWLKYRIKKGAGKKSSPLDDIRPDRWTGQFTTELLELLWVLEASVAGYLDQAKLLESVVNGPCFNSEELPDVPEGMRKPPPEKSANRNLFE